MASRVVTKQDRCTSTLLLIKTCYRMGNAFLNKENKWNNDYDP